MHDELNSIDEEYEKRWRWLKYGLCEGFGYGVHCKAQRRRIDSAMLRLR